MNRDLEIVLVSAALVLVMSYGLRNVIRSGETMLVLTPIRKADAPGDFWGIVAIATIVISVLVIMSAVHFYDWLLG